MKNSRIEKISDMKHLILLTCTVKTRMTSKMKRSDPQTRLNDYIESIKEWNRIALKNNWKVVIAENSNSIDLIKEKLTPSEIKTLNFFPASLDELSHMYGNSAGEFGILRESILIRVPGFDHDYLWKITGRLYIPNFKQIANQAAGEIVVNRLYASKHQVDARIVGFTPKLFATMFKSNVEFSPLHSTERKNSYESMEHYLTQKVLNLEISGVSVSTMKKVPIFVGFSGTSNKRIDNFFSRCKKRISNFLRPLAIKLLVGSSP